MKIRITWRQASEDGAVVAMEWTAEENVHSWEQAFDFGKKFRRLIDGIGMGNNVQQDTILGEPEEL